MGLDVSAMAHSGRAAGGLLENEIRLTGPWKWKGNDKIYSRRERREEIR